MMDIEEQRRAARELEQKRQQFEEEQEASKIQIKDLLDKFEEKVRHIEMVHSRSTVGPTPIDVVTPQVSDVGLVSPVPHHSSYKLPPLVFLVLYQFLRERDPLNSSCFRYVGLKVHTQKKL